MTFHSDADIRDLRMTKLCASAIGLRVGTPESWDRYIKSASECWCHIDNLSDGAMMRFDPLHDDAQCMALEDWLIEHGDLSYTTGRYGFKEFKFHGWAACNFDFRQLFNSKETRRRYIVECVAKMMEAS